jgi:carbonic anhydrase
MLTRRNLCCAGSLAAVLPAAISEAKADECLALTKDRQAAISPDDALRELKAGNERFLSGNMRNCDLLAQVRATAGGQAPIAAVLGCIDARVPPELVFDQRIGDIFSARIAGNFVNPDILGSLEFATKVSGAKLIVVLGHSECGAIKGAIDRVQLGDLTQMLAKIRPAVEATKATEGEKNSKNTAFVQAVAEENVALATRNLKANKTLGDLVASKEILIAGAMHDVSTGRVTFLD